jgi:AmmeMemoRadiSam system protein A
MENKTESTEIFTKEQGQTLVELARQTIMEKLGSKINKIKADKLAERLKDHQFKNRCGTFVTINMEGRLRGCIGNLAAQGTVLEGIRHNSIHAAFKDPRFPPLSESELSRIDIEISILSDPKPLDYKNSDDLIDKLRVHVDGVILKKGFSSATFLPQVWKQLPDAKEFLSHLCLKAGLAANEWQKGNLEILTYQVQYFEE